jgi:hypothetical protein
MTAYLKGVIERGNTGGGKESTRLQMTKSTHACQSNRPTRLQLRHFQALENGTDTSHASSNG